MTNLPSAEMDGIQLALRWLKRIDRRLRRLESKAEPREHYSVEAFAKEVGRAIFTVRQWCNFGRVAAAKANDGRTWVIPKAELDRYRKEGLRPDERG